MLLLVMLSQKLRISYPIFLVLAGLALSFIPGLPVITIDPDLIFLIFLPPLLYQAAWDTSWRDFWRWRRPIMLLAFGLVFFTSTIIAYVSKAMIPGFTLSLGFLLGASSPTRRGSCYVRVEGHKSAAPSNKHLGR
ncbi:cation:proton antiporter domain-containing protein [Hymenobacter volaticus]|uniref:cation:proton antiporter domain-containing protein n=1 Tax=Hymenobacter volaticus TaxID=2932254 RepID=UPI0035CA68BF